MALHLIKALKNRRHVVLESPTGTGKSAAILCSTLAWQRYHKKTHSGPDAPQTPRIIYCSRTHSQVTQMISSLRKTPYRPKMAILGSRERLCIHKKVRNHGPSDEEPPKNVNVNLECRTRVSNTELMRKRMWQSNSAHYDDDNPPVRLELDSAEAPQQVAEEGQDWIDTGAKDKDKPCCPHYRQLSTTRTASLAYENFVPQNPNCCTRGGEHTKLGSHDIEDLVEFAQDPYVKRGVAVYREQSQGSFGMQIGKVGNATRVTEIYDDSAIAEEGSVRLQHEILTLNGQDTRDKPIDQVANMMRSTEDPLLLDVTSDSLLGADDSGYSQHSPCPYYLSRALANHAELIFCPYNYVLDPSIRKSLNIDLEGAIVVLGTYTQNCHILMITRTRPDEYLFLYSDEAHNVEDTLRESGSGKFGEIQLCEIVAMLVHFSSASKTHRNTVDTDGEKKDISELAHALLLFVEQLVTFLMEAKTRFEQSPGTSVFAVWTNELSLLYSSNIIYYCAGKSGARSVIGEWERFHTPDDTEFEMTYDGPNGRGLGGKAAGCKTFFDKLSLSQEKMEGLQKSAEGLDSHVRSQEEWAQTKYLTLLDNLNEVMMRFAYALEKPE
jgi:hypothetical protein